MNASKLVFIPASFIQFGILGGLCVLFFFITTLTSFLFFYISPRELLITVSFLVGLHALMGDVGVSFSAHMLHLYWLEASFEVLEVHSIVERSIGAPLASALASDPDTVSPSAATASSNAFNC